MGRPRTIDGLLIDRVTGEIEIYFEGKLITPERAFATVSYGRKKGPKVIAKADVNPKGLFWNPDADLVGYDLFYVIDTNTRVIEGDLRRPDRRGRAKSPSAAPSRDAPSGCVA